jgi:hypothetical protein
MLYKKATVAAVLQWTHSTRSLLKADSSGGQEIYQLHKTQKSATVFKSNIQNHQALASYSHVTLTAT